MGQLAITNIINVSVAQANLGVNAYNTGNLAIFTDEVPASSFGTAGFKLYVEPTSGGVDFGTASKTFAMMNSVFSQQPNILTPGGQLIVYLMGVASQTLALSGVPASGAFEIEYNGNSTASIPFGASAAQIQSALQLVPGLSGVKVTGSLASESLIISMGGVYGAAPGAFTVPVNTLETSGSTAITFTVTTSTPGVSLASAISTSSSMVQYFGILTTETVEELGAEDVAAAAAVIAPLNKIAFWVGTEESSIQTGGILDLLRSGGLSNNRGLYYGDPSVVNGYAGYNALVMASAYAALGLSVNFSGSNTTITMNLKSLIGVQPDPSMTQTIYNEAKAAGADIYASIQGDPAVLSFGANQFYDQVYNLKAFVGDLLVACYNYLAQTPTKIPQTETGMDGFKGAQRTICQKYVTNQYLAPGSWTSPTTFGNQAQLYANMLQFGYYIYSQPIALQLQTDRAARVAPLVQIGVKEAGAIQSGNVIVYVNP